MERSVEAGYGRHLGEDTSHHVDTAERRRLVQGGEIGERSEALGDPGVEDHRSHELCAAVDDAMTDGLDRSVSLDDLPQRGLAQLAPGGQVRRGRDPVAVVHDRQLQAAGAGVHDEDTHDGPTT
jgi:hypothetical protein